MVLAIKSAITLGPERMDADAIQDTHPTARHARSSTTVPRITEDAIRTAFTLDLV